jgi:hypothetical protein
MATARKEKKTNGKTQPILPQNQREKPLDPKEKNLGSPQKGESSRNQYAELHQEGNVDEFKEY